VRRTRGAALPPWLPSETTFVTASTGIAAVNIGGTTLHRFAGLRNGDGSTEAVVAEVLTSREACVRWRTCQALVVDEISMVSGALLDKLDAVAQAVRRNDQPFGGIQVLLFGDFLPWGEPVCVCVPPSRRSSRR
jgi:ATP-dependent DNA helicase PIF1